MKLFSLFAIFYFLINASLHAQNLEGEKSFVVQSKVEDLTSSRYLIDALVKVPNEYAHFMTLGNQITSITSKTMVDSTEFTLENQNCNYGPDGVVCTKAAKLTIRSLMGRFIHAEIIQY